jgi:protein-L-isoaspartate(D-aspartate) O-methyltransferase
VPRNDWIDDQLRSRGIVDERVLDAMATVPRELFVPRSLRRLAYEDEALPLGAGQTISQPYVVAFICQGLALRGDERVLDVGTGSGYQAAVLGELAAEVHSVERIPELAAGAREALAAAGYGDVTVDVGDGTLGLPAYAPYDGIAVAAASPNVPAPLLAELRDGGRMVIPLGSRDMQELAVLQREREGLRVLETVSVRFVPLLHG